MVNLVTNDATYANLAAFNTLNTAGLSAYAQANAQGTYANGTPVVANVSNLNFNNTATVNVSVLSNGNQSNIAFTANANALIASANSSNINLVVEANGQMQIDTRLVTGGGGGSYQVDVSHSGSLVLANANLNFLDTQSVLGTITANGTTEVNVSLAVNATLNLTSLNVSANISNTGNLLVSQNTFSGNLSITQNTSTGNDKVTQNSSIGNVSVTQNTSTGNLSVVTLANIATANIVGLISSNTTTYANGTIVVASANLNFNNTATINVSITANGTQSNVALTANANALITSSNQSNIISVVEANGQIQIDTRVSGPNTPPGSNTWIGFNNTGNWGSTINLTFNENGNTMNVWNVNITCNIANAGNILVTGNISTGNIILTQNVVATNGNLILGSNTAQGYITVANTGNINCSNINVTQNIANVGNLLVTQNSFTGNLSVTQNASHGNVTATQNTSTGNLSVTQNTITGNIIIQSTANVVTLNANGAITANQSPLINLSTRTVTGLSCNLTANVLSNGNSAQTNLLSVTFNEVGMYQIEGMLFIGSNNQAGAGVSNTANSGVNVAIGNSGTATIATIKYAVTGRANGSFISTNIISTTAQSVIIVNPPGGPAPANSTNGTDYLMINGYLNVSATGTINIQVATSNSKNLSLNVMPNSYIVYTKIG